VACCDDSLIATDRGAIPSGPAALAECIRGIVGVRHTTNPLTGSVVIGYRSAEVCAAALLEQLTVILGSPSQPPAAGTSGIGLRDLSQQIACAIVKSALEPAVQRAIVSLI
jgi:hypothetical protein